jgi:methylated-DNA-[protein]-cysteine S-methyltransferase
MIPSRLKKARTARPTQELQARVIEAAAREGLVDVAYAEIDSPLGKWLAAVTERGLVRIAFTDTFDDVLEELASRISPRVLELPARLDVVRREFDEYFEGHRTDFEFPLDWQLVKGFNRKVLRATARIPYGSVSTYSDMAKRAGSPRAARAAGNALHNNPIPLVVPCHRVLHRDGGLGGYGGGLPMKEFLLKLEGALDRS